MTSENTTTTDIDAMGVRRPAPTDAGGSPDGAGGDLDSRQYVGFWARVGAHLIDYLLFIIPLAIPLVLIFPDALAPADDLEKSSSLLFDIVFIIYYVVAFAAIWRWKGATPGKMIIGAKIVDDETGELPSMKQCLMRSFLFLVEVMTGGLLWVVVAFSKKKQAIHDMAAKTVVIKTRK